MKTTEPPILCGTDLSENAAQVATVAAALAARAGKPLMLVHVADEFNARGNDKEKLAAFLRPVRKQLAAEAERLRKAGATVEVKLLTGRLAERRDPGTRGKTSGGASSWFLPFQQDGVRPMDFGQCI